jgi:EAL domain-containing protein (putative c-di-GMP-specific phosphodiesterase class I)
MVVRRIIMADSSARRPSWQVLEAVISNMQTLPFPSMSLAAPRPADYLTGATGVDFDFSFAFQPIVDAVHQEIVSFEALVRGPHGESSSQVFALVPPRSLNFFDQACRRKAIGLAARLNLKAGLNLNLLPNSSRNTRRNVRATLEASLQQGFPVEHLVFEVSEAERIHHYARVGEIFKAYEEWGFRTAIDDFGAGLSGLHMLATYQPDYLKLDRNLIADVHANPVKQVLVGGLIGICRQLSIDPIAEGVEKAEEYHWLRGAGIHLFQGFYFARPVFEALSEVRPSLF